MAGEVSRYPSAGLRRFIGDVLAHFGVPERDAALGAGILHDADLTGVDTHGIGNLASHAHYVPGLRSGAVVSTPRVEVLRESPSTAAWDSGRGFGPVVAHGAMEAAMDKAERSGVGVVTVRHGLHFGANGYFAEMAARRGLIGMVTANTPVAGFPPRALRPVVGTNPFAFAAPVADGPPIVVDIALTAASGSKVTAAAAQGLPVVPGWVVDAAGMPTTDASASRSGGGLELLGGQLAGHKGYGLALMVDVLGILAGNGSGLWQAAHSDEWSQGQWFAAWRIDLFVEPAEFMSETRRLAEYVHAVPVSEGPPMLLPGERRSRCRDDRRRAGVPLADGVVRDLTELSSETGIPFPDPVP